MTQQTTILYTARTHTSGGRDGRGQAIDGELDLALSPPGSGRPGTNPEQLLAIGWSACFIGALRRAGQKLELRLPEGVAVDAEVSLGNSADGGFILAAQLTVHLPGLAQVDKKSLVDEAHQICPYSKATRGNIEVNFVIP
ncbi:MULTISPECIES: organic hydroperoxide resistance protein [Pseudomonas]|uniref:Organic hydroperoxide resistance protein n=3 Tax=Pseudomonas TaxID=286 RepID=A0ABN5TGY3_9PSED|nr:MULTISPECIES: organic hydroperoxide resistance protein [Pseudomonas]AZL69179.1 organic hydroperoxide resistance protein [Pseudomonas oryziphila]AZL74409.1 organic hydroperoxide resistance protein [Pseudomonas oryziphila]MDZ4021629.1 Organic hydroperoxide resistance protein OhrB [Pseudomonas sichuanensis]UVL87398.1 organic hydroperoxide resistance protein [Pseudomonas sichuanensis]